MAGGPEEGGGQEASPQRGRVPPFSVTSGAVVRGAHARGLSGAPAVYLPPFHPPTHPLVGRNEK